MKNTQLIEKIKNRKLSRKELSDIYEDLVSHLDSEYGCETIENYTGECYGVMDLCFEHYNEVFDVKELSKYQIKKVRNYMQSIIESPEKIRPELAKMVVNYLAPKGMGDKDDSNTIKIVHEII